MHWQPHDHVNPPTRIQALNPRKTPSAEFIISSNHPPLVGIFQKDVLPSLFYTIPNSVPVPDFQDTPIHLPLEPFYKSTHFMRLPGEVKSLSAETAVGIDLKLVILNSFIATSYSKHIFLHNRIPDNSPKPSKAFLHLPGIALPQHGCSCRILPIID